ncbi:hypothetical protein EX30DRAFT_359948, partial [Ascodesmis nigricans]
SLSPCSSQPASAPSPLSSPPPPSPTQDPPFFPSLPSHTPAASAAADLSSSQPSSLAYSSVITPCLLLLPDSYHSFYPILSHLEKSRSASPLQLPTPLY